MGFWGNLANEAGKKTGKAIGNKLFGKYADDVRIGVRQEGSVGVSAEEKRASLAQARAAQIEAEGKAKVNAAEAKAIDVETERKQNEVVKRSYEQSLSKLQQFYDSFNFNLDNVEEIENKSMAIISWLQTVDWSAKESVSKFVFNGNNYEVNDTSKAKTQKLIKQLSLGVERLKCLNMDKSRIEYIESKLEFYLNKQAQEIEAERIRIEKRKANILKILTIIGAVLAGVGVILGIVLSLPNPKKKGVDCKEKVVKLVDKNDIDNATKTLLAYEGWEYDNSYVEAKKYLVEKLLKTDRLDEAIEMNSLVGANCGHSIRIQLIKKGLYNEAAEYFTLESNVINNEIYYYTELCIIDMCEKGEISRARKFIKRRVTDVYNPKDYLEKMNNIINSYL